MLSAKTGSRAGAGAENLLASVPQHSGSCWLNNTCQPGSPVPPTRNALAVAAVWGPRQVGIRDTARGVAATPTDIVGEDELARAAGPLGIKVQDS
jgi:hypothetical protein